MERCKLVFAWGCVGEERIERIAPRALSAAAVAASRSCFACFSRSCGVGPETDMHVSTSCLL